MFFYRRDPYYDPAASCFGTLIAFLVIAAIVIVCAIYIGFYLLIGMLILGAVIGGAAAIYSLFKALPQTVSDIRSQYFNGNKIVVALKSIAYFFVCITKYSISNDFQFAKEAFQRFGAQKTLSLRKWINFALGVTVMIFGLLMNAAIILAAIAAVILLLIVLVHITVALILIILGISIIYNLVKVIIASIKCALSSFSPTCFKFRGRCDYSDMLDVPATMFSQLGQWISSTWSEAVGFMSDYRSWLSYKKWFWIPIAIAMLISCPIVACIIIALGAVLTVTVFLPVYIIDVIWILIKSIFKF